jgi:pimeloyl-ACP methyl ester carboxylesterase
MDVPPSLRRNIVLDRPKIDDYASIFDDLPPETIVCGFSLGAIVAAHFADRMTAHRLILFGVNPFADDPAKAASRHDLAKDVNTLGGSAALKSHAPDVFGPNPEQTRAVIHQMAATAAGMIGPQTRLALSRPGAIPALARASMPVLALTGTHDKSAPPNCGMAAAQAAPNGQFVSLEGLGHFALLEDPNACATAVIQCAQVNHDAI